MTESFAQMFEESLANQKIKPGAILTGTVVDVEPRRGDRQRRPEVRSRHPGRAVQERARRDRSPGRRRRRSRARQPSRTASARRACRARRPSAPAPGRASRRRSRRARSSPASSAAASRAASPSTIEDVRAFLPGSLVDVRPVRDPAYLEGKALEFKVIKLDQKRNNVVVSRRAVVEQEYSAERERAAREPAGRRGAQGRRSRTSPTTARSSTSAASTACCTSPTWRGSASSIRPKSSTSATSSTCASSSSTASATASRSASSSSARIRGQNIARRYPPNTRLFGKVTNIADYGCFVEIEEGVEGLVHVSEMDWTNKNVNPAKVVQVGDEVEVMVLDVDEERRRISLGIKQCKPNPWEEFAENYKKGDKVSGQIKSITDFGVFIGLPAASTASCTCRTSRGTCPAKKPCATTRRARRSRPWCWRSIRSASASRSASSSSRRIRSRCSSPSIRRAASSTGVVQGSRREGRDHRPRRRHRRSAACLRDRRAIASRTRAPCSRSATKSRRSSRAWIARRRIIALSIKAKEAHEEARGDAELQDRRGATRRRARALGDLLKEQMTPAVSVRRRTNAVPTA